MNKQKLKLVLLLVVFYINNLSHGQSPFYSETLIKYDLNTHKTDKPIPFDQAFTLVIEKLSSKNVVKVHAFEAEFKNGNRDLVNNIYIDYDGTRDTNAIKDITLNIDPYSDVLRIFFPPLKPNIDFDVNVIYELPDNCSSILMKVNSKLSKNLLTDSTTFYKFYESTVDKLNYRTNMGVSNFEEYKMFYNSKLKSHYKKIIDIKQYKVDGFLSEKQIQAYDINTKGIGIDHKDGAYLIEIIKNELFEDIQCGKVKISNIFQYEKNDKIDLHSGHLTIKNIKSNIEFFDSLLFRVNTVISSGVISYTITGEVIDLNTLRSAIQKIRRNLIANHKLINTELDKIKNAISNNPKLKYGVYLSGNTVSSDLKTEGGNILFVDAGLTNIVIPNTQDNAICIPKLYYGVSIYFRPINKNTRRNKFPKKSKLNIHKGCHELDDGSHEYGPDYGIVATQSIWQHLSLNIGLTNGSYSQNDFDNLYNKTSLLVGPAYRFSRAFKFSMGVALLNRDSKNPFISEKKMAAGGYFSLSVDLDLIQGIKNVTSILYK